MDLSNVMNLGALSIDIVFVDNDSWVSRITIFPNCYQEIYRLAFCNHSEDGEDYIFYED